MKWSVITGIAALCGAVATANTSYGETLQEAVAEVLRTHPQVRSQASNRLARDHEVNQARSDYYPRLDLSAGAGVEEFQEPENDTFSPVEMRLSLRQNVFAGFSTKNEVERQQARVKSAAYSLLGVSENIALDTARAYLEVLRRQELKAIAEENVLNHHRIADQIQLRSESGVGSQVDSDQVEGRLSLAESNVVVTQTNLLDAQTNYQALVGYMPANLVRPEAPEQMLPASLDAAVTTALQRHPTLKSAVADLEARHEQHQVAASPFWPQIDIEVDQIWDDDVDGVEDEQQSTLAMLRLRYNFFQGFNDKQRRAETRYQIEEAREIKNNTHRQVVESIRLSWMAYQSVLDRIKYLEQHVKSSTATVDAYIKQFDIGRRSLLDVLDTEAEVIEAKRDLINATYDGLYSQYRILNGMGKLIEGLGLEPPAESALEDGEDMTAQAAAAN